jgi:hypothetical protein
MHPLARPRTAFAETQPTSQPGPLANCVVAAWHGSLAHRRKTAKPGDGTPSVCELAVLPGGCETEERPVGAGDVEWRFRTADSHAHRPP